MATYQDAYLNMPETIGREVSSGVSPAGSREVNVIPMSQIRKEQDVARQKYVDDEIKDAAEIYANKMGVGFDDAHRLMRAKYENQTKMAKYQIEQQTRDLEAQNSHIDAMRELSVINPADPKAVEMYDAVVKKHAPNLAGTSYFKDFTNSLATQRNEAIKFSQEALRQKTQERLTKAEERKAEYESPEMQEKLATIRATAGEKAKEAYLKAQEESPEGQLKKQKGEADIKSSAYKNINDINKQIAAELSTFPGKVSFSQLQSAIPVDEKGRPKPIEEATHFLVKGIVQGKEKKNIIDRASVLGAIQTVGELNQAKRSIQDQLKIRGLDQATSDTEGEQQAPVGMTLPSVQQPSPTGVEETPATQYSTENPYAAKAAEQEKSEKQQQSEAERKALIAQTEKTRARLYKAEEALKNPSILLPKDTGAVGIPQYGGTPVSVTDKDMALAYEQAKKEYADALAEHNALLDRISYPSSSNEATTSAAPSAPQVPLGAIFK